MHSDTLRNVLFLNFVWTIEITSTVPVCAFEYTYFYNNIIQFKIFTSIHTGNYTLIFLMANQLHTCRPICSTMINFFRHTGIFTEKHNCSVGCIFYLRKWMLSKLTLRPRRHQHFQILKSKCMNLRSKLRNDAEYWLKEGWWQLSQIYRKFSV